MERHFERDLNELKERLLWMGSLAERAVHQAVHSVLDSDEQLAKRVLDEEDGINELQSLVAHFAASAGEAVCRLAAHERSCRRDDA